jgi:UDP:flavonoid glycosyltransferase YjiC (YdhE family)
VPVIAAGSVEEKPMVVARVEWSGAGLDLKTGRPSPEEIRKAVHTILADAAFPRRAKELKVSVGRYNALETTAEIVESALSTGARSA